MVPLLETNPLRFEYHASSQPITHMYHPYDWSEHSSCDKPYFLDCGWERNTIGNYSSSSHVCELPYFSQTLRHVAYLVTAALPYNRNDHNCSIQACPSDVHRLSYVSSQAMSGLS